MPGEVSRRATPRAVGVDQEELRAAVLGQRDGEPAAVRRPRRRAVAAAEVGEHLPLAGGRATARRRPASCSRTRRRRCACRRATTPGDSSGSFDVTIACGLPPSASATMQLVARALLGDVGDARREHARVAGQLLVDDVGDLVRGRAELRRRDRVGHRGELRLLDRVDQREAHLDAAVGQRPHRPDDDGVGAARAPVAGAHVLGAHRPRRRCRRRRPAGTGRCARGRRRRCR